MDRLSNSLLSLMQVLDRKSRKSQVTYRWTKLQAPTSMIRLLLLFPGKTGPLRCSIFDTHIDAMPEYEAISHHWGDPTPTCTLAIGDKHLCVARSIFGALMRVRKWNTFRILWIDGLCIDQNDIVERSQQILMMKTIFKQARQVVAYLGREADESQLLPSLFNRIQKAYLTLMPHSIDTIGWSAKPLHPDRYAEFGLPEREGQGWEPLRKFLHRPYFRRIWIAQEIALSKEAVVLCGGWEVAWSHLSVVIGGCSCLDLPRTLRYQQADKQAIAACEICSHISILNLSLDPLMPNFSGNWTIAQILRMFRCAESTDDKDKIYGILGLAEAVGETFPHPDYRKDKHTIYAEYASFMIAQCNAIEVFYECFWDPLWPCPSWVPNWALKHRDSLTINPAPYNSPLSNYAASLNHQPRVYIDMYGSSVHVEGIMVDTVKFVTQKLGLVIDVNAGAQVAVGFVAKQLEILWQVAGRARYPTSEMRDEVIWRTLTCNWNFIRGREIAPAFGQFYQALKSSYSWLPEVFNLELLDTDIKSYYESLNGKSNLRPSSKNRPDTIFKDSRWTNKPAKVIDAILAFTSASFEHNISHVRCATETGYLGQVPLLTQRGDQIFIPCGSAFPFIVRQNGSGYILIGKCYIHDIMKGEIFRDPGRQIEEIRLI